MTRLGLQRLPATGKLDLPQLEENLFQVQFRLGRQRTWAKHGAMRLLKLAIQEPIPQRDLLPLMAETHGAEEAARRYRALVITTLRQLRGLVATRIRLMVEPEDGAEAVRFWLLPKLADRWQADEAAYLTAGWEIDFGGKNLHAHVEAEGDVRCPFLGARWVHAAMLGLERGHHQVIGPAAEGGVCFRAAAVVNHGPLEKRYLPELPLIQHDRHWQEALQSPLGPSLRRAWEEEA